MLLSPLMVRRVVPSQYSLTGVLRSTSQANDQLLTCASRLICCFQGPILGCAFGYSIRDRTLFVTGFLNEIFALVQSPSLLHTKPAAADTY